MGFGTKNVPQNDGMASIGAAREEERMAKKARRATKKARSNKWSRANIMNYIAGGIVALSMVLGSVFVFGGAPTPSQAPQPTPIITTVAPTATPVPAVSQGATTPTPQPTP